ncbi:ATP-binding protein [Pseudoalteromonas sp. P1-8]|uniref:ATP-binding protein n=1 Tax=Pseudoalteromonas sp. P1-8 TaxID=1710353 RepID=UPI0006E67F1D|nr:ATP-binding protein [Pseudoalteromonas sp. P1-8]KPV99654.1 Phytochrome-like protein cph1 [Pseudoalteromonas sp. P1-8]
MSNKFEVSLDNCHKEPIHIPGSIQPHGYLLVVDPETLKICYFSENILALLNTQKERILGSHISNVFAANTADIIEKNKAHKDFHAINPLKIELKGKSPETSIKGVISRNDEYLLIELEFDIKKEHSSIDPMNYLMKQSLHLIADKKELNSSFDTAVEEVRNLTGFDRVMLYQFDHEYNGQVVAEAKKNELNSFLHQHFPESDIPKQARALYLRNPIRLLADVDAEVSPIYPQDKPVDLSTCITRSVSPIHCQYLRNMGVKASMSISIIIAGKLWGLIACHHYSSHVVPFEARQVAQYMGLMLSYIISLKTQSTEAIQEAKATAISAEIAEHMSEEVFFIDGLRKQVPALLNMLSADGVAWRLEKDIESFGDVPANDDIYHLFEWLKSNHLEDKLLYHNHHLSNENAEFSKFANIASGVLAMPVSTNENLFIMWFRKELIETKNWGGKPEKIIEFLDDGSHRLMPRSSFRLWQENVRNKCSPWKANEISCAIKFRNHLVNHVIEKSERLKKLNDLLETKVNERTAALKSEILTRQQAELDLEIALRKSEESNQELERFAFVASHDLQEPLRKIQMFGDRLQNSKEQIGERNASYISRMMDSAERMQKLIKGVLSFSRINRKGEEFRHFSAQDVFDDILDDLELIIADKSAVFHIEDIGEIYGDKRQIQRLFQNLILNALKFSHPHQPPIIGIKSVERTDEHIVIAVIDNGIGFNNEFKDRIFNLFERVHSKQAYEGTGLGLAICKKIVERHHGTITAEANINEGSQFYVNLPLRDIKLSQL